MKDNPEVHHRRSIRLKNFYYGANGAYYITICTQDKMYLFGEMIVGAGLVPARVRLNPAGAMIEKFLKKTINRFPEFALEKFIIMPNHIHCIISLMRAGTSPAPTLGDFIRAFKSETTVAYIRGVKAGMYPPFHKRIWQRNYYEHIIRDANDYNIKWKYIDENPIKWAEDEYYVR